MSRVSITAKQRKKYTEAGSKLISKGYISGFQLEDFVPTKKQTLIYGHSSKRHVSRVKNRLKGRVLPRESHFRWMPEWETTDKNTILSPDKRRAYAREVYLQTNADSTHLRLIKRKLINREDGKSWKDSWKVPDVRVLNATKKPAKFKKAYLVQNKIDRNSRFATIVLNRKHMHKITKTIPGKETISTIYIQNFPASKANTHSFWNFIKEETRPDNS